jgi:5'(3')-deoxyribonucleotidase
MDNVLVDFKSGLAKVSEEIKQQYECDEKGKPHYDDIPGIFALMEPMPGAIEAVKTLSTKYDLYILSTAPWMNPSAWSDKVKWVQKYFDSAQEKGVFYKRLILCHHKDLLVRPNAYLIDDRPKNGAEQFRDNWIQYGKEPFLTWESVVKYLM